MNQKSNHNKFQQRKRVRCHQCGEFIAKAACLRHNCKIDNGRKHSSEDKSIGLVEPDQSETDSRNRADTNTNDRATFDWILWKDETNTTDAAFKKMPSSNPGNLTPYIMKKWLKDKSGLKVERYDCCPNSCMAFVGPYNNYDKCAYCGAARFDDRKKAKKTFEYISLIERLRMQYASPSRSRQLRYRVEYITRRLGDMNDGVYSDVFDGQYYKYLTQKGLFSNERDIALGLSTDGFNIFKKRGKECWPILLINYNIAPEHRVQKQNLMLCGIIPGPSQPLIIGSFLWPLLQELQRLEEGLVCFDADKAEDFLLHAYLIAVCGDMPAIAKLGGLKGSNSIFPCRYCSIRGIYCGHYYYPLKAPRYSNADIPVHKLPLRCLQSEPCEPSTTTKLFHCEHSDYDVFDLPQRTHEEMVEIGERLKCLNQIENEHLQKATGTQMFEVS